MAGNSPRRARVAALIQRVVATSLERDIHDPRLEGVTITEVRVTGDLQIARIYWTQYADPSDARGARQRAAKALEQAKGRLRSRVGRKAGLRLTPAIEFVFDEVPGQAREIDDVLVLARQRDEQLGRDRQGKAYAGEADPYRHDDEDGAAEQDGDQIDASEDPAGFSDSDPDNTDSDISASDPDDPAGE